MRQIAFDCIEWQTRDDFYDAFFAAVGAPSWHGRNFNALRDSICTGSINEIEAPYEIIFKNSQRASTEMQQMITDFARLIEAQSSQGCNVSIRIDSGFTP